jgi:hypothetical protein
MPADLSFACPAFDLVEAAAHPSPEDGGPCSSCAFRPGTEANRSAHTVLLAKLCIEGGRMFSCHERPGLCRGYIAAANLRGLPFDERATLGADILADIIEKEATHAR